MLLWKKIQSWYEGELVLYDSGYAEEFIFGSGYRRHWTANFVRMLIKFCSKLLTTVEKSHGLNGRGSVNPMAIKE